MPRVKLKRFLDNQYDPRIIQEGKPFFYTAKGNWARGFFGNDNPIVLELGCGKGEYTIGLAQHFPWKNFIGVDKKGDRMRVGLQRAKQLNLQNVAFLRTIIQHIDRFFAPGEVSEIRLVHPDPRLRNADAKRRLTHPRFLELYKTILSPEGLIRLKTDNVDLFRYSLNAFFETGRRLLKATIDLYASDLLEDHCGIVTKYERLFVSQGCKICYAVWTKD